MCIAVFMWQAHSMYPFLLLLNRDEYHNRQVTSSIPNRHNTHTHTEYLATIEILGVFEVIVTRFLGQQSQWDGGKVAKY